MIKPVLHVGLPKAASTFLQKRFFPKFEGREYFATGMGAFPAELSWVFSVNRPFDKAFARWNPVLALSRPTAPMPSKQQTCGQRFLFRSERPILVSSEGLCGVSYAPHLNNFSLALWLKEFFGPSQIIVVFRNQADWCESIWRQLVFKEDRFRRYVSFDDLYDADGSKDALVDVCCLDWGKLIGDYRQLFGCANVLALPYELLVTDYREFLGRIMEFVGERFEIEPNFGTTRENVFEDNTYYRKWYGEAYLPFAIANALKSKRFKLFSHVAKRLVGGVLSATVGYTGVSPLTKKRIREATSSMNQDLSRIIGMDLSKYGYY